jgi:two-component system chemotaxis response regulator CheB
MKSRPYRILIVDHSNEMRQDIRRILESSHSLDVIGEAEDGREAFTRIPVLKPDVITLDIISTQQESLSALKRVMIFHPTPVIILTSFLQENPAAIFDALSYGAIDFITLSKALLNISSIEGLPKKRQNQLIRKVCLAATMSSNSFQYIHLKTNKKSLISAKSGCKNLVVLGVGEGGYGTLLKIIPKLTTNYATAYIIISYEENTYLNAFIAYLNHFSAVKVQPTLDNMLLEAGGCYISSGNEYVTVHGETGAFMTHMSPAPFVTRRGSIDMLMFSVSEALERPLGVILSGEGGDGAEGLEEMVRSGGGAIIQSPTNCLYDNMVLSALNLCEEKVVVADREIATEINNFLIYSDN